MGDETQEQIAHSLAEENYAYQFKALGFMALETFRGVGGVFNKRDFKGQNWRHNTSMVAQSIGVLCFGIRCQIEADQGPDCLSLNSALFQISALGDFVAKALECTKVQMQGDMDAQRKYVMRCGVSIQDFCESIAVQICSEPSQEFA